FIKADCARARTSVSAEACDAGILNSAERPCIRESGSPNRTFTIFEQCADMASSEHVVPNQLPVLPACETLMRANPQSTVSCGKQAENEIGRKVLILWRLPWEVPYTVETQQSGFRSEPKVAVRRLGDGCDSGLCEAVADLPCRVRVLTDIQRWIQRERARTPRQDRETDCDARHDAGAPQTVFAGHHAHLTASNRTSELELER